MFYYNAICVISDLSTNKAGTITSGLDRFMEWKTKDGDYENTAYAQFDTFYEGMFQKARLLDILKNFILFSGDGQKPIKILAGYHQYFAVRKAIEKAKIATKTDGKGGVFWHTQGETMRTPETVLSGIRRAAENLCRWYSMPICCKKLWTAPPSL